MKLIPRLLLFAALPVTVAASATIINALPNSRRILDGHYGTSPVDGAVEVKGKKYQEYGEGFYSQWKPVSELKSIRKGVIRLPSGTYFCLNSMMKNKKWILPNGKYASCSAKGWFYKQVS